MLHPNIVYHITTDHPLEGSYSHPSLETEGFIHCSTAWQVNRSANKYYKNVNNVVVMAIDSSKLHSQLVFEDTAGDGTGPRFPHIYGPVNPEAIIGLYPFSQNSDGHFEITPDDLPDARTRISDLVEVCAKVPSFSSYEERLHSLVETFVAETGGLSLAHIADNNLLIRFLNHESAPRVALTAHLDKINHFGLDFPAELPFRRKDGQLIGQLDNTAGLGVCLHMLEIGVNNSYAPFSVLFSEMEEGKGKREHPEWLKNNGEGYKHGLGAERISAWLIENDQVPGQVLTIDTTPLFKGESGMAVYSNFWELTEAESTPNLITATEAIVAELQKLDPDIKRTNNTNDYLVYGEKLNTDGRTVPSLAIEPAIFPYHQKDEGVFEADLHRTVDLLTTYLRNPVE